MGPLDDSASLHEDLRSEIATLERERDELQARLVAPARTSSSELALATTSYGPSWVAPSLTLVGCLLMSAFQWSVGEPFFAVLIALFAVGVPIWWYLQRWCLTLTEQGIQLEQLVGLRRQTKLILWSDVDRATTSPKPTTLMLRIWKGDNDQQLVLPHASRQTSQRIDRELKTWLLAREDTTRPRLSASHTKARNE